LLSILIELDSAVLDLALVEIVRACSIILLIVIRARRIWLLLVAVVVDIFVGIVLILLGHLLVMVLFLLLALVFHFKIVIMVENDRLARLLGDFFVLLVDSVGEHILLYLEVLIHLPETVEHLIVIPLVVVLKLVVLIVVLC